MKDKIEISVFCEDEFIKKMDFLKIDDETLEFILDDEIPYFEIILDELKYFCPSIRKIIVLSDNCWNYSINIKNFIISESIVEPDFFFTDYKKRYPRGIIYDKKMIPLGLW